MWVVCFIQHAGAWEIWKADEVVPHVKNEVDRFDFCTVMAVEDGDIVIAR